MLKESKKSFILPRIEYDIMNEKSTNRGGTYGYSNYSWARP